MNLFPLVVTSVVSFCVGVSAALWGSTLQADPLPKGVRSISVEATISKVETNQAHEEQRLKPMGDILIWSSVVVPVSHKITFVTQGEEIPLSTIRFGEIPKELEQGKKVWMCYLVDARAERSVLQVANSKDDLVLCEDYREQALAQTTS